MPRFSEKTHQLDLSGHHQNLNKTISSKTTEPQNLNNMKTILTLVAILSLSSCLGYAQEVPPPLPDPSSAEANAVQITLLAKAPPLTNVERGFVLAVQKKIEGAEREGLISTAFYTAHSVHFAEKLALIGTDPSAWTPQLIDAYPTVALGFINKPNNWNDTIAAAVYAKLKGTGYATLTWRKAFKKHRRTLPLVSMISVTTAEVDALTDLNERTPEQNLWLAELTLDLAALRISNPNP
jgi:hypothetical protein